MTFDDMEDISYDVASEFEKLNVEYISDVGKQIRRIGNNLDSFDVIAEMIIAGNIYSRFKKNINIKTNQILNKLDNTYDNILSTQYKKFKKEYEYSKGFQIPISQNKQLQNYANQIKNQTQNVLYNISNNTVADKSYISKVDRAVLGVNQGTTDYITATRNIVKEEGTGAKVIYKSGATRRLDSAVRMNVLDGMRTLSRGMRDIAGRQFGADGIEVSAHALCAEDHLDVEGEQYSREDFDIINNELAREIGTCNCKHYYFPIILGISQPAYSEEELEDLRNNATEEITIDGTTKSRYQWSQEQRLLETSMRKTKEQIIISKTVNDKLLEKQNRNKLNNLKSRYNKISNESGLSKYYNRASVPGFK